MTNELEKVRIRLLEARSVFAKYEKIHRAKNVVGANDKALANKLMKEDMEDALSSLDAYEDKVNEKV